jgi:hypothetical protein
VPFLSVSSLCRGSECQRCLADSHEEAGQRHLLKVARQPASLGHAAPTIVAQ